MCIRDSFKRTKWAACFGGISGNASDCLADKGFSHAVHELAEDVEVHVYNLHAEAGGDIEDMQARQTGYEQLIEAINAQPADLPLIVGGDTNLHEDDEADEDLLNKLLAETDLQDACAFLQCGEAHIDRFLFRSSAALSLVPTSWAVATEFVDDDGLDLSDHPAIRVTFEWHEKDLE